MQVRWPSVFLVFGTVLLIWLLVNIGRSVAISLTRLTEALLQAAERDPVFALGLVGMGVISALGLVRLLVHAYR